MDIKLQLWLAKLNLQTYIQAADFNNTKVTFATRGGLCRWNAGLSLGTRALVTPVGLEEK